MKTFFINNRGFVSIEERCPGCWVNIECPDSDDSKYLIDELQIPVSFLNDIEDIDERPRLEDEDGWYMIIIRIPYKSDNGLQFSTVPMGILFKDNVLATVCHYKTELIDDFILYTQRKQVKIEDGYDLVLRLLLSSSVWYLKYLKQINTNIKNAEQELKESIKNRELQKLLQIEKCLVFFITSLKGNSLLFHKLYVAKSLKKSYDEEIIEDVEIELKQALEMSNIYSDILSGLMDAYASVISNNLNVIMKQLTSISIILMIPTLIASLYGMNVPNMFENDHWGFLAIIIISFTISIIAVLLFMKKKWF